MALLMVVSITFVYVRRRKKGKDSKITPELDPAKIRYELHVKERKVELSAEDIPVELSTGDLMLELEGSAPEDRRSSRTERQLQLLKQSKGSTSKYENEVECISLQSVFSNVSLPQPLRCALHPLES